MDVQKSEGDYIGDKIILPITVLNPIYSAVPRAFEVVEEILSFDKEVWLPNQWGSRSREMSRKKTTKRTKKNIFFYTGMLPRLINGLDAYNLKPQLHNTAYCPLPYNPPYLPPVTFPDGRKFEDFRPDQRELIDAAVKAQRGVLKAFTGFGKSLTVMGIISAFPTRRVLFLTHSIPLLEQVSEDLRIFYEHGVLGGKKKQWKGQRIVLATRQSAINIPVDEGLFDVDILFQDECHHTNSFSSDYFTLISNIRAPIRIGVTATLPTTQEGTMALEAAFGPVIAEMGVEKGEELGLLAPPKIHITEVPNFVRIRSKKHYMDSYMAGVVNNQGRNEMVCDDVEKLVKADCTVLVVVTRVLHGKRLQSMLRDRLGYFVPFISGGIETESRENVKDIFKRKEIKCCVANVVWREGIDIPSLDCVVNASGGKSEIMTLQTVGRGLRKPEGKSEVLIVDYKDGTHKWFEDHFGERMRIYKENNWEMMSIDEFVKRRRE